LNLATLTEANKQKTGVSLDDILDGGNVINKDGLMNIGCDFTNITARQYCAAGFKYIFD
jgi:hypothetical protein